jgi:sugar-phosphatase
MIRAIIFDFDGLLAESERLWYKAEQATYARLGMHLDEDEFLETTGLGMAECVAHWRSKYPWDGVSDETVMEWETDEIVRLFRLHGQPKPGAVEALKFITGLRTPEGEFLPLAIASSSPCKLLDAAVDLFGWGEYFKVIHSGEEEEFGKPHPAVYLGAARKLGVSPLECLALEDSLNGLLAAKAARMKCVAVPEPHNRQDPRFAWADAVLDSLHEFNRGLWQALNQ